MAKDAKPEAEAKEAAAPKKSKKFLIIIVIALLLLLLIGGAAAFFMMSGGEAEEGADEGEVATEKAPAKKKASKEAALPVFVAMDTFTVNLDQDTGGQYLQVVLSLEVEDAHMNTPAGKEALAIEIRSLMNEVLEPGAKEGPVKEVLFTNFIIQ